jgi:hypothetical protein
MPSTQFLSTARVIREPVGHESGYWAGAPGVFYATEEKAWYLTYRIRRPRGIAPDRGGEARIARSVDLHTWEDVWSVTKDQFSSASIERCALYKQPGAQWRYFASYVDPEDGRWCVSVLEAPEISRLAPANARPLFKAHAFGLEGIKDPWIFAEGGIFYMFLSVALPTPQTRSQSHSTLDIYNTGECVSATGLATSSNLVDWSWQGVVFAPERGTSKWDQYCRRINSIVPYRGNYVAYYDGSASHLENYEEKTGLAVSSDLRTWRTNTPNAPLLTSPHASGSFRYVDASILGDTIHVFYEFARPDGAHDVRLAVTNLQELVRIADAA